jgi:hypothetical protein
MKHLKTYEKFSEKEIDEILDKMNRKEPLTKEEEFRLKNPNEDWSKSDKYTDDLISEIKSKMNRYGESIGMGELQADSSPIFKSTDQSVHLIEILNLEDVNVCVYGGYKYETLEDEYKVPYEELSKENLKDINDLLNDAVNSDIIGNFGGDE